VFEEEKRLVRAWDDLQEIHGDRFSFARALNLEGIERLDIRTFPNLAFGAWFSRQSDATYRNMVAPKPTLETNLLQVYTVTSMGSALGATLSDDHTSWLASKGVTRYHVGVTNMWGEVSINNSSG
jgi:hypothetical protein